MYIWKCEACGFHGATQEHRTHHVMYHLAADTLLIELLNELPPDHYPLKFKEARG
jgi:hypothetical protein